MMNSWIATGTDLLWNVWTGSGDVSIRAYLLIQLIILKSESMIYIRQYHYLKLAKQSSPFDC